MTVAVTGSSLTLNELVRVARLGEPVSLDPAVKPRMEATRRIVELAVERGDPVYGVTTGVAALKRIRVPPGEMAEFNAGLLRSHLIAQGPAVSHDVVRAMMLRLLNHFATGYPGVRPLLVEPLVGALNAGRTPAVRSLGSVGLSDLGPNADLAATLYEGMELRAGEALALLNHNAYATALAGLALTEAAQLADSLAVTGALSLEAFAANLTSLHPAVAESRPYPGLRNAVSQLRSLLEGSYLWKQGAARNLQDPVSFRSLPQTLGVMRESLDHATSQLATELNASQGNPIVVVDDECVISVGNFDILPLATALDSLRIAMAPAITSCGERTVKLLEEPWSGLSTGLNPRDGPNLGLAELGVAQQSMVAEARLLAQPVSYELASTAHAEGIEDRMTLAPLSARRLSEMIDLAGRCAGIELVVSAQAIDARGQTPLGAGTAYAMKLLRERVPFAQDPEQFPRNLDPVTDLIRSGGLLAGATDAQPVRRVGSGSTVGRMQ